MEHKLITILTNVNENTNDTNRKILMRAINHITDTLTDIKTSIKARMKNSIDDENFDQLHVLESTFNKTEELKNDFQAYDIFSKHDDKPISVATKIEKEDTLLEHINHFLREKCIIHTNSSINCNNSTPLMKIYTNYLKWAREKKYKTPTLKDFVNEIDNTGLNYKIIKRTKYFSITLTV